MNPEEKKFIDNLIGKNVTILTPNIEFNEKLIGATERCFFIETGCGKRLATEMIDRGPGIMIRQCVWSWFIGKK